MRNKTKSLNKLLKVGIIIVVVIVIFIIFYQLYLSPQMAAKGAENVAIQTATVETKDIESVLSSSGTIEPIASYDVTTLVSGEIISANFEEGDLVQEGQILYQIDTDTINSNIDSAESTLSRAKRDYTKAEKNYQDTLADLDEAKADYKDAVAEYSEINILSTDSGTVTKVYVEKGNKIQVGSKIADIYDNSTMVLTIPFSLTDAQPTLVGKKATVSIDGSFESITGKVTKIGSIKKTLSGNRVVKEVTIEVPNPGSITESTTANANIGDIYSMDSGSFTVKTNTSIFSDLDGEIELLNIKEGDTIKEYDFVLSITQDTVDNKLENYINAIDSAQNAVDNAKDTLEKKQDSIEDAESSLQDKIDNLTDYKITAPVSGKVISKNTLKGDTISNNSINTSALCTIYDLSAVTFEMYIDELDVLKVHKGQKVNITADALEGVEICGVVTYVSLESESNQGVTQYPVTVLIDNMSDLLPGMNVTGEIVLEKAEGVLAIPSDALQRGDTVYVKDNSVTEADENIPDGLKAVKVTTGITDGDYVEIISGLSLGDEVYLERVGSASSTANMSPFGMGGQSGGIPSGGMPSGGMQSGGEVSSN